MPLEMIAKIQRVLADPAWWFSTVVVSLLVSLAAAYVKDWVGIGLARYWPWFKTRLDRWERPSPLC